MIVIASQHPKQTNLSGAVFDSRPYKKSEVLLFVSEACYNVSCLSPILFFVTTIFEKVFSFLCCWIKLKSWSSCLSQTTVPHWISSDRVPGTHTVFPKLLSLSHTHKLSLSFSFSPSFYLSFFTFSLNLSLLLSSIQHASLLSLSLSPLSLSLSLFQFLSLFFYSISFCNPSLFYLL